MWLKYGLYGVYVCFASILALRESFVGLEDYRIIILFIFLLYYETINYYTGLPWYLPSLLTIVNFQIRKTRK